MEWLYTFKIQFKKPGNTWEMFIIHREKIHKTMEWIIMMMIIIIRWVSGYSHAHANVDT